MPPGYREPPGRGHDAALEERLNNILARLDTAYDGIGHSSGKPYLYFVYPPTYDQYIRRLADDRLRQFGDLHFIHIDLIRLSIDALAGQEERRAALLNDPVRGRGAGASILRVWRDRLVRAIESHLVDLPPHVRPVVVLRGLAALHPLGNPTGLMEAVAEKELRSPHTQRAVPVLILVPGANPSQAGRTYDFLGLPDIRLTFYRGEEM